jgi:hypothetical protein
VSVTLLLFLFAALVLFGLLFWSVRPHNHKQHSPDEILKSLAEERHYCRLPQILQALRPDDVAFLKRSGDAALVRRVQRERRRIANQYLDVLQEDFETLLEAAGLLATMAPDVTPMQEWERLKLSARFAFCCTLLRWRLRLGLTPWGGFGTLAEIASGMAVRVEAATSRIGERAALAAEIPSMLEQGRGDPL